MFRIYYYKKTALAVDEKQKEFFFTSTEIANDIPKENILSVQAKYALHNQADLLLELGYTKTKK